MLESSRTHSVSGSFGGLGGAITGATNATPIVVTTTNAHGLADGDQVQVTGVVGNTGANTLAYVKVTGYSTTTFGMYSNTALSTGIAGTGAYSSGGAVSQAWDISGVANDWTMKLRIETLGAGKKAVIALQDSVDGFVADIVTRMLVAVQGQVVNTPTFASKDYENRKYDTPGTRFGVTNARLRVNIIQADSTPGLQLSAWYES
jgi:hypothetical protein